MLHLFLLFSSFFLLSLFYHFTLSKQRGKSVLRCSYTVRHHQFVMYNLWWNVVIPIRFLLCPLCFNLPHQLLPQSVISQNDFHQLSHNTISQQEQPKIPLSPGGARLINCKTIKCITTISNAKIRFLCELDSFAGVAHLFSIIQQHFTVLKCENIRAHFSSHPVGQSCSLCRLLVSFGLWELSFLQHCCLMFEDSNVASVPNKINHIGLGDELC